MVPFSENAKFPVHSIVSSRTTYRNYHVITGSYAENIHKPTGRSFESAWRHPGKGIFADGGHRVGNMSWEQI
jgi:hypothetical protein